MQKKSQFKTWQKVRLSDFVYFVTDGTHDTPKRQKQGKVLITSKQLKNGIVESSDYFILEEDFNNINKRSLVEQWDILISMIGTVGEIVLVKEKPNFAIKNIGLIKNNGNEQIGRFIYFFLKSPIGKAEINRNLSGTSQSFISLGDLRNLKILIPESKKQIQKIASILSAYDDLIEVNNKKIKNLEEMAQTIYNEWFIKFKFPGYKKAKFKNGIPEGWDIKKHSDVIDSIVLGGTPARKKIQYWENGTIPWIKSGKLNNSRIIDGTEFITEFGLKKSATKLMPKRSVLMAITGTILIGISEIELCANQSVIGLYNSTKLTQEYIYLYERSIIDKYIGKMSGSAQQHINKEIIQETKIVVPDIKTIKLFDKIIRPIFDKISILLFMNANLRKTRDLLLPKLMSGEIRI